MHQKALVVGSDTRAFLAVCRSLGRQQIEVHALVHPLEHNDSVALNSKYISSQVRVSSVVGNGISPSEDFKALLASATYDLVFPCSDEVVIALMHEASTNNDWPRLAIPNRKAKVFFSKPEATRLARTLGISVPVEHAVSSADSARHLARDFGLPLVMKPVSSVSPTAPVKRREVTVAHSVHEIGRALHRELRDEGLIAQRFFRGTGIGVEVLCRNGEVQFAFQHERIHEPFGAGGSSYRKSVEITPSLFDAVCKLSEASGLNGLAMFEFIYHFESGEWVFLECNPRVWGSLPLALEAGADFPYMLWQQEVHGQTQFTASYRTGIHSYNLTKELSWMRHHNGYSRRGALRYVRAVLSFCVKSFQGGHKSDCLVPDDPMPGIMELVKLSSSAFRPLTLPLRQFIESFRVESCAALSRRRIHLSLASATRVLFVCKGNICRSPFAASYLRKRTKGEIEVKSAGYYPRDGREAPTNAQEAAQAYGVALQDHRSRLLSEELLDWADLVFVFDLENWETVSRNFRDGSEKLVLVGANLGFGGKAVRDPFGGDLEQFHECYVQVKDAIKSLYPIVT